VQPVNAWRAVEIVGHGVHRIAENNADYVLSHLRRAFPACYHEDRRHGVSIGGGQAAVHGKGKTIHMKSETDEQLLQIMRKHLISVRELNLHD
jgi:hypothetical protein